jgi:hypothetical protein
MKTLLIITTWLAANPSVVVQPLDDFQSCKLAQQATVQMLKAQALTNLTGGHQVLKMETDPQTGEVVLKTPIGREIVRARCVRETANPAS